MAIATSIYDMMNPMPPSCWAYRYVIILYIALYDSIEHDILLKYSRQLLYYPRETNGETWPLSCWVKNPHMYHVWSYTICTHNCRSLVDIFWDYNSVDDILKCNIQFNIPISFWKSGVMASLSIDTTFTKYDKTWTHPDLMTQMSQSGS